MRSVATVHKGIRGAGGRRWLHPYKLHSLPENGSETLNQGVALEGGSRMS